VSGVLQRPQILLTGTAGQEFRFLVGMQLRIDEHDTSFQVQKL
jgi:hypothetical protein